MRPPFIPPEFLQNYLNGTATQPEKEAVEAWYASLRGEPNFLSTLPDAAQETLRQETYQTISRRLNDTTANTLRPLPVTPTRFWPDRPWKMLGGLAAAIAFLVWIGLQHKTTLFRATDQPVFAEVATPVRFVNHQSRIVRQRLPDGTLVWLHPLAELRYPKTFGTQWRDVSFAGEAFFDVAKDARRPFRIQSGTMQIQVVGTRFNVRATPRQAIFEVAVVSGKVIVRSLHKTSQTSGKSVTLLPKQEALYDVATAQISQYQQPVVPRREIYEPASIRFADTPVSKALRQLEARFKVRVRVANPALNTCRLTADFTDQTLPVILELLCASLDATYTMAGETVILNGDGCP